MFGIIKDGTYRVENIGYSTPELTSGYIVATRPIKREADLTVTGELFGRWTDEDGTVYWDAVEVHESYAKALNLAYLRDEKAIWDIAENKEIRVSDWYPTEADYLNRVSEYIGF